MNISLTPELERYVQYKVSSGMYTSASEVVRESLRLMHLQDDLQKKRISQLNQEIEAGLAQLDSGQKIPGHESHKRLKAKLNQLKKQK